MPIQKEYLLSQKFNNINHNSYSKLLWLKFYAHSYGCVHRSLEVLY